MPVFNTSLVYHEADDDQGSKTKSIKQGINFKLRVYYTRVVEFEVIIRTKKKKFCNHIGQDVDTWIL